mmetsp:Transcript_36849/g.68511  ORF Transcript_36849/g.68511 Transcript_36849/m.68511 type:complete len:351 (-) Transcript_36849:214-1266(-)
MSQDVEYYDGMRIIAFGREGTILKCYPNTYDIRFTDGAEMKNVNKINITPFESVAVAKQVGGPPPPSYTPSAGVPQAPQYQYPQSQSGQPVQYQQQQYAQPSGGYPQHQPSAQPGMGYVVGVSGPPVVHSVPANTVSVSATPVHLTSMNNTQANATKVSGFEHSPNMGQPFANLFDCSNTFWMSCCCPCIVGGQVAERLHFTSFTTIVACYIIACIVILVLSAITNNGLFWLILWGGWVSVVLTLRMRVKSMWQIPGDSCDDCCVTCCCLACSLAQVSQHVFGYRGSDSPPCGSDGTPPWQHQHAEASSTPPAPVMHQHQPQMQQHIGQQPQMQQQYQYPQHGQGPSSNV